ncbi:MAG TPA: alpha/beta hydrolase [Jatrophihabitantaceae bacterium]
MPEPQKQARIVERRVVVRGTPTRVLEVDGDGPPVLLLHGFTDSADSWRPLLRELAARSRRAVAVDMPGSGWAAPMGRPALRSLDDFAAAFLDAFGEGSAVVAGNSLGGLVAFRAARDGHPALRGIVGIGPAGFKYGARLVYLEQLCRWTRGFDPILDPLLAPLDHLVLPAFMVRLNAARMYHHLLARGRAEASLGRHYASHLRTMRDLSRIRSDLVALGMDDRADPLDLSEIATPVLLIWGRHDRLALIEGAQLVIDALPETRLIALDAGHCPQVEVPADIADMIVEFAAAPRAVAAAGS